MKLGQINIDPKYLPSRKFVIGLSIVVALVLIAVAFSFRNTVGDEAVNNSDNLSAATSTSFETFKQIDTDKDGLPDWQESLYGTDPKKADTDGDGTPDGEEIKAGRDPLKANTAPKGQTPNDKMDSKIIAQEERTQADYEKLNETQKFSRDFFSNFIASQPADRQMTQDEQNTLISQMMTEIESDSLPDKYLDSDMKLSSDNSYDSILKYKNSIARIMLTQVIPNIGQDMKIFSGSISTDNTKDLNKIDPIIKSYQSASQNIIGLTAPSEVGDDSLSLANNIYKMSQYLSYLKEYNTNIVKSIIGMKGYGEALKSIGDYIKTLNTQ